MSEQRANLIAYIEKGMNCYMVGKFDEARIYWYKALEIDPHNAHVLQCLQYISPQSSPDLPALENPTQTPDNIQSSREQLPSGANSNKLMPANETDSSSAISRQSYSHIPNIAQVHERTSPEPQLHGSKKMEDAEEAWLPMEDEEAASISTALKHKPIAKPSASHHHSRFVAYPTDQAYDSQRELMASPRQPTREATVQPRSPSTTSGSFAAYHSPPTSQQIAASENTNDNTGSGSYEQFAPPATKVKKPSFQKLSSIGSASRPVSYREKLDLLQGKTVNGPSPFDDAAVAKFAEAILLPKNVNNTAAAGPMMAQSPNESSPLFRSRPKDLSTRFLPTIANKELNPDDFIDPLEAQTFTAPVPFELINSLEANSSKPRIISGADAFAPSSRPISIDPELHRPKRDLSTRFLSTIDQLKSNPDDLLEPSRETQEDLASPFLHTTTAPIPITPTDIQQHYPSQAEWESPSMEFSIEDIASVRAIGYRDKPDLSTRYLPKIKSQIASVDELVLEMEDEPSSKSINPMHQHLVNPDDLIEECANLNEIGGQDITSNGSMIGNKKHNNAPLEVYSEEQSGNQDMGNIFSQQELFLSCEQSNHNYSTDSSNFESDDKGKNSSHSLLSSSSELSYSDLPFTRLSKVSMPSYVQNNVSSQSVRVSLSHSQDVENDYLEVEFLESNSEISSPDDASMLSEIYDESINNSATDPSMLGIAPSDIEDPLNYVQLNQDYTTPLPFPVHNQNYPQQGDGVVNPWPEAQGNYDQAQNWPQGTGYDQAHSWQAQGNYNQAQNWPQGTGYDQAHSWQTQGNYDHQAHSWQAHEGATQTPMWQVENSSDPFGQEDVSGGVSDPFGQEDVSGSVSDPFGQEDVSGSVSDPFGQEDISGSVSDPFGQEDISGSVSDPFGQEDVSGSVSDPFGQEDVSGGVSDPFGQEDVSGSVSDPFGQEDVSGSVSDPFEQMSFDSISSEQADGIGTGDMLLDISSDGDTSERENSPVFAIPSSQFTNSETNQPSAQELPEEFAIILSGAEDLLYEEDYLGAKYLLDVASKKAPDNEKIKSLRQLCDQKVLEIYREEFTSLDAIPERIKKLSDILSLDLDHRAGFVLSQIDGSTTISELLFLSGVKEDEIFMILGSLKHQGIIKIR